jgi:hypothetical protein
VFVSAKWLWVLLACAATFAAAQKKSEVIKPGEAWFDDRGQQIQAHGGGIIRLKDTYYWFG